MIACWPSSKSSGRGSTGRKGEIMPEQEYKLAWKKHWICRKLFDWYGDACLKAKVPHPLRKPPSFEPAMRKIVARADKEWTQLTDLPRLDACDPDTWWTAAIAAAMQGQPVPNVRLLSARALTEIILPWALARRAAAVGDPDVGVGEPTGFPPNKRTGARKRGRRSDPERDAKIAQEYRAATDVDVNLSQSAYAESIGMTRQTLNALLKRVDSVKSNPDD